MKQSAIIACVNHLKKETFLELVELVKGKVQNEVMTYGAKNARVSDEEVKEVCAKLNKFGFTTTFVSSAEDLEYVFRAVNARLEARA